MKSARLLTRLKNVAEFAGDMFFPEGIKCIACDCELVVDNKYSLCNECKDVGKLVPNVNYCKTCGSNFDSPLEECLGCKKTNLSFDMARAPLVYKKSNDFTVHRLIMGFKFKRGIGKAKKYLSKYLAQFLIDCWIECFVANNIHIDLVTFVPVSKVKLAYRGYNQAYELAKAFVQHANLPLIATLQKKTQKDDTAVLNREERFASLKGAIGFDTNAKQQIANKSILLIDDICTSGATANECSRILKANGATEVFVLTVATSKAWTI